jgi:hypothetical protein
MQSQVHKMVSHKEDRMKRVRAVSLGLGVLLFLLLTVAAGADRAADSGIDWQVLSGGGAPASSSSGVVALNGSLAQTAIGPSAGGSTSLGAGFWYGVHGVEPEWDYGLYLPLIDRND